MPTVPPQRVHLNLRTLGRSLVCLVLLAGISGCFNENSSRNTNVYGRRFEVAVGAPVHGGRQLLVDSATGDLWYLDVPRSSDEEASWKIWSRGPDDLTPLERAEVVEHLSDED